MTIGILGKKLGMTQVFLEDGTVESVTVVEAGPCVVTQVKTKAKDGYEAVQIGFGEAKRLSKPEEGHVKGAGGKFLHLREFPAGDMGEAQVGQRVDASLFKAGDLVDVTGITKGRGFSGVVRRHGFRGGPKTHGQSDRHRAPGAIGAGTHMGKVTKGMRMAGHYGVDRVTARNLRVVRVDLERNLMLLRGAVPGANLGIVTLRHAKKALRQGQAKP
ncbi:MAG: 50S ribosomal protein L3 [Chloroflexi bacterium]|nr:50S ribosomal protein L3 [Chloroflexota bacterium]